MHHYSTRITRTCLFLWQQKRSAKLLRPLTHKILSVSKAVTSQVVNIGWNKQISNVLNFLETMIQFVRRAMGLHKKKQGM
jgi:hypothetical protein